MGLDIRFANTSLATARALPDALFQAGYHVKVELIPEHPAKYVFVSTSSLSYRIYISIREGMAMSAHPLEQLISPSRAYLTVGLMLPRFHWLRGFNRAWRDVAWRKVVAELQRVANPDEIEFVE